MTLATYVFFIFTVIGRQKLDGIGIGEKPERMQSGRLPMSIDLYIPVYTVLQFFFYMGLLKVRKEVEEWNHAKDAYEIPTYAIFTGPSKDLSKSYLSSNLVSLISLPSTNARMLFQFLISITHE